MKECNGCTLKIDDGFKNLIPQLSADKQKRLAESIIRDGCREPIHIWNKTILDGHRRYEICVRHQIPFKVERVALKSREEAVSWICAKKLKCRTLSEESRRYLIGKRYEMEQIADEQKIVRKGSGLQMSVDRHRNEAVGRAIERLGREYRISCTSVARYGAYTKAIDSIVEIEPELISKVLTGQIKISQENILELSRLSPSDIRHIYANLAEDAVAFSDTRNILSKTKREPKPSRPSLPEITVKNMPVYDPDAEMLSLVLTIPSWVSSVNRARCTANLAEASSSVRCRLGDELNHLRFQVDTMLALLKEEN